MFRLIIKKFRNYSNFDIEIPEKGLIRLHGPSGIGKTTIFDAIKFALDGDVDDPTPWGESKAEVSFHYLGVEITRTKGPNSLKLTEGEKVLRDEAAQSRINQLHGMNPKEWLASSYIKSSMEGSLLSLPPAEQLRLIQELATGSYNPEVFKEKINEFIKEKNKSYDIKSSERATKKVSLEKQASSIEQKKLNMPERPIEPTEKYSESHHGLIKKTITEYENDIKALKQELLSQKYTEKANLEQAELKMKAIIERNNSSIDETANKLKQLKKSSPEEIDQLKTKIISKNKHLESKKRFMSEVQTFLSKRPQFKGTKLSESIPKEIESIEESLLKLSSERDEVQAELVRLEALEHTYECPECNTPLKMGAANTLNKADGKKPEDLDERKKSLSERSKQIKSDVAQFTSLKEEYSSFFGQCEKLKNEMGMDPHPDETMETMSSLLSSMEESNRSIEHYSKMLMNFHNEKIKEEKSFAELCNKIKSYGDFKSKEEVQKDISELETHLQACRESHSIMLQSKSEWDRYESSREMYTKMVKYLKQDTEVYEINKKEIENLDTEISDISNKLNSAKKLKELADFASISACDMILDSINEYARAYLDKFFPEDGTSVILKNTTTTKSGDEKPKLSLSVFHKGKEAKKLSSLSHGEKSRVFLAFQLALSEMYNSPMLLIDEGFSGLPPEHKSECLEMLKEVSENKLVFIIEHGADNSLFNEVVDLTGKTN